MDTALLDRADDGMDRPALPVLPSPADAPRAALYRDDHHRRGAPRRPRAAARLRSGRASGRGAARRLRPAARSPSARASAPTSATTRSTSMSAARPTACRTGRFGACLMAEPALVGDCVAAMKAAVAVPVTVKCRIGIDEQDPEESLDALTRTVVAAGVDALIVHARKAWLDGLSPKENRDIPPLDYERVYRLKRAYPELHHRRSMAASRASSRPHAHLAHRRRRDDGPRRLSGAVAAARRRSADLRRRRRRSRRAKAALEAFLPYVERELARGTRLHSMTRHMLGPVPRRAGRARASAGISRRRPSSPAPALRSCATALAHGRWTRARDLAHIAA